MAARSGLIRHGVAAAFAIAGMLALVVALHDLYRASAPSARVVAGLVAIAGVAMLYAAFPAGAGARMREAVHLVAAGAACLLGLAIAGARVLFVGADASIIAFAVGVALFAATAWVSRDGWSTLRAAPLRLAATAGLLSVSAVLSVGKTVYTGIHPALITPVTLNLATSLKPAGSADGRRLVSATITISNPTDDRVNIIGSQYYVAGLATPCPVGARPCPRRPLPTTSGAGSGGSSSPSSANDPSGSGTGRFKELAATGAVTDQEWLNPGESSSTTFVAAASRGDATVARLFASALVARGELDLRAGAAASRRTYDVPEPSWLLRYAEGPRTFRVRIARARQVAGRLVAPRLTVGGIASRGGVLGRVRAKRPISGNQSTASTSETPLGD